MVFDELPNRVEGVVPSFELVLVGVTFSSAMPTPDMRIWNINAITKREVLHRIRVLREGFEKRWRTTTISDRGV